MPRAEQALTKSREFAHLLSPLPLKGAMLPNRVVMGAMHTRIEMLDRPHDRIRAFYRARAEGEVGMIITGGIAPNWEGRVEDGAQTLSADTNASWHNAIVESVAGTPTLMCLQILHTGRYAKFAGCVAPSAKKSRINRYVPRMLSTAEVWRTVTDFACTAELARGLGYHAVEIMGSEGYLINQFTAPVTNDRQDEFGGTFEGRVRFPLEILKAVRAAVGPDFPIVYRISALDLIQGGMAGDETVAFARLLQGAGCDILNTGVGWHESTVPTIAHVVPRAAWTYAVCRIKQAVAIPVIASNRINDPYVADDLLARGYADLVSMARPLLADPAFVRKARTGRPRSINTCIACNQACLDRIFLDQTASCLVNPRAGQELDFDVPPPLRIKRIAVVGAGAAGMNFAFSAAERGHEVTLYEAQDRLGGQLLMARNVPGKTEFDEMLRYFAQRLEEEGVDVRLRCAPTAPDLAAGGYDEVVIATGVQPRRPEIPGIDHPKAVDYVQVLLHGCPVGRRVAIIGAGGIAFDVVEFLLGGAPHEPPALKDFVAEYDLDLDVRTDGGLLPPHAKEAPRREVTMLQRTNGRLGAGLAPSTGWIHRDKLRRFGVNMLGGAVYERIDDTGLHIRIAGEARLLDVDTVIVCAGQESERRLSEQLRTIAPGIPVHLIGGADIAVELDAMRAIDQATRLAMIV
jgi:2,4-dienoyl-CoA reductase (NADPH2)